MVSKWAALSLLQKMPKQSFLFPSSAFVECNQISFSQKATKLHAASASPSVVQLSDPRYKNLLSWTWAIHCQNYNKSNQNVIITAGRQCVSKWIKFEWMSFCSFNHLNVFTINKSSDIYFSIFVTLHYLIWERLPQTGGERLPRQRGVTKRMSGLRASPWIMVTVASGHVNKDLFRVALCILEVPLFISTTWVQLLSITWEGMALSMSKLIMLFIKTENSMWSRSKLLWDDQCSH